MRTDEWVALTLAEIESLPECAGATDSETITRLHHEPGRDWPLVVGAAGVVAACLLVWVPVTALAYRAWRSL